MGVWWIQVMDIGCLETPCNLSFPHVMSFAMNLHIKLSLTIWLTQIQLFFMQSWKSCKFAWNSDQVLVLMLDPRFKNMCLVTSYVGHENVTKLVTDNDSQLLLLLFVEFHKSLMGHKHIKVPKIVFMEYNFLNFKNLTRCVHQTWCQYSKLRGDLRSLKLDVIIFIKNIQHKMKFLYVINISKVSLYIFCMKLLKVKNGNDIIKDNPSIFFKNCYFCLSTLVKNMIFQCW